MRRMLAIVSFLLLGAAACAEGPAEPVAGNNGDAPVGDPLPTPGAPAEASPVPEAEGVEDSGLADPDDGVVALADGDRVRVTMGEFVFAPHAFEVSKGSTVTFTFRNEGLVPHEAFFGDAHMQDEHEQEMLEGMDHGEGHHGEGVMIELGAGDHGKVRYHFDERGEVLIGCHIPGHYEAGMVARVTVS